MPEPITPATAAMADAHDALREKATPGPWIVEGDGWVGRYQGSFRDLIAETGTDRLEDPAYIATLANDDAAMCAAVREWGRLRAEAEWVRDRMAEPTTMHNYVGGWHDEQRCHACFVLKRLDAALAPREEPAE